jgi:hypothetical protein
MTTDPIGIWIVSEHNFDTCLIASTARIGISDLGTTENEIYTSKYDANTICSYMGYECKKKKSAKYES